MEHRITGGYADRMLSRKSASSSRSASSIRWRRGRSQTPAPCSFIALWRRGIGLSLALPSIAAQQFRHGREAEWEAVGGKILIGRLRVSLQEGPLWGARTER